MKVSIVIPAHNEQDSIAGTIRGLESALAIDHEVVVVNDHSSDQTAQVVGLLTQEFPQLRLVENHQESGFANALRAGFKNSVGELIVPVMADLCDDPGTIEKMYENIVNGFDVVCGSRYMKGGNKIGGPKLKTFFSRFVGLSLYLFIGIPTHDIANSFKMYKKHILDSLSIEARGFEISIEIPLKAFFAGYKITQVPTTWIDRKSGESKFNVVKQGASYFKLYRWALKKGIGTCLRKKK